jgi:TetR/AcrR family transcriptional repressor of nem operon
MIPVMRYGAEHKQKTRGRLLAAAAAAIRREGPDRVSVAGVMGEAGLTHGGFYAHFASREDLLAEAVTQMFRESDQRLAQSAAGRTPRQALADYVGFYLSPAHREARSSGCPLPFLAGDAPRLPAEARARFAQGMRELEASLAELMRGARRPDPQADAGALLAELVGALALARAEPDRDRAEAMLAKARARVLARFDLG